MSQDRDPVHDVIAQTILKLGEMGFPATHIRAALAVNLVNLCGASSKHGRQVALSDVKVALSSYEKVERATREKPS